MSTNAANQATQQGSNAASFAPRAELVLEAQLGENRIVVLRFSGRANGQDTYIAEIAKKDDNVQLLLLPGIVAMSKGQSKITLEHYGVRESGVSGFIKSQVTGESFVMSEAKGAGIIRLAPNSSFLGVKHFQNNRVCIPNTNVSYLMALIGNFEVVAPPKGKANLHPIVFTEIKSQNALALMETETFYELQVTPDAPVKVEVGEIIFWTGDLNLEEDADENEANFVNFSGSGSVYLSLNV